MSEIPADLSYRCLRKIGFRLKKTPFYEILEDYKYPVCLRPATSDPSVFRQIFVQQEYSCLTDSQDVKLVVDCGAYVGYSSIYFLNKFPDTYVIALEPDRNNFEACHRNLRPYGKRAMLIPAALWSHPTEMVVCRGQYRDGREWATQVRECRPGEMGDIKAFDLSGLLSTTRFERIDILKIDIEGAELEVFGRTAPKWLKSVRNIVIELHNDDCEKAFFRALSGFRYDLSKSGELTVCKNISAE